MHRLTHRPVNRLTHTRLKLAAAAGVLAIAAACGGGAPPPPPAAAAPTPPPVKTAAERVKWYQDCWQQFNDKAWDAFQNCYSENAMSESVDATPAMVHGRAAIIENDKVQAGAFSDRRGELKLVLNNGTHIVGVALWTATNDGPMPGPDGKPMPPTKKKIGLMMAHSVETDPTGAHADGDAVYLDGATVAAQLGLNKAPARKLVAPSGTPPTVIMARNDETETGNVAAYRSLLDASNKHDMKAVESALADSYMMMDMGQPADMNKKQAMAQMAEYLKGYPDMMMSAPFVWSAGDYVVAAGNMAGTNTGDMPSMKMKKTGKKVSVRFMEICKLENGKITEDWMFYNSAAFAAQLAMK